MRRKHSILLLGFAVIITLSACSKKQFSGTIANVSKDTLFVFDAGKMVTEFNLAVKGYVDDSCIINGLILKGQINDTFRLENYKNQVYIEFISLKAKRGALRFEFTP